MKRESLHFFLELDEEENNELKINLPPLAKNVKRRGIFLNIPSHLNPLPLGERKKKIINISISLDEKKRNEGEKEIT